MPSKQFLLEDDLPITIYKRKSNRSLRLSLSPTGEVRVTIPAWAPYSVGLNFAKSRQAWIISQRQPLRLLSGGQAIGKAHHLHFKTGPTVVKVSSRVSTGEVTVTYPQSLDIISPAVQKTAQAACVRALRIQAEQLLPQRLASLATAHDFSYQSVSVKRLKSRWGSCDHQQNIVLNLYLMQLPWEYIDYVLLHELTHTQVLRHGPDFWQAMEQVAPQAKRLRKALHDYQPVLDSAP